MSANPSKDPFLDGPRHWPDRWRKAWIIGLPFTIVIWPGAPAILVAALFLAWPFLSIVLWFRSMWRNTPYKAPFG